MGEVWEGLHVPQQIPIAVKILTHRGVQRELFVEAFRNEVRGLAGLNHPGIVTVLDYGEMPAGAAKLSDGLFRAGSPYLVMELGRRGSLKEFVDTLGWVELKAVLVTILDALAHAHAAGVIHRDLKPANILVGCGAEHSRGIKLTDFGLAHAIDQHEFAGTTDSGWGTPQFMAPEQFRGAWRDYGPWTDLYALGVMAFYLCAGVYPHEADDTGSFARAHQIGTPRAFVPRFPVPADFAHWIARLMHKQPRNRFQYAADAAWALQKMADPPNAAIPRDTASLLAISDFRSRPIGDDRLGGLRSTAAWRRPLKDDAPTMLDQPATTRLVDFGIPGAADTHEIAEPSEGPDAASAQDRVSYREAPPLPYTWQRPSLAEPSPKLLGAGLGLYGLRTLPMVGREHERDELWAALRRVRAQGAAAAVVIRGAAGTGKSRLAQWLTRRAHEVGSAAVLKAIFSPMSGPGDGLSRMVAQQMRAGGMGVAETLKRVEAELDRHGARDSGEIAAVTRFIMPLSATSPEIEAGPMQAGGANARYSLLLRHLQRLSEERPVVVWFDDVQWSADALAFVQYVLERQHNTAVPALFVLTVRDEALETRPVESQFLTELTQNRRTHVLKIDPLASDVLGSLVRDLLYLAPALAGEVERRCRGNPLFAVQLVGDWVAGGKLRFGEDGFHLREGVNAEIPDDLDAIWRERLALLLRHHSAHERVALEIAAALGGSVELSEWYGACAEYGVAAPTGLARDLLESGLVTQTEYGFQFCHGLLRESVEEATALSGRGVAVHQACMRMLKRVYPEQLFPFAERYAQHIIASGDSAQAVDPLWTAARNRTDRSEFDVALALLDARDRLLTDHHVGDDSEQWSLGWTSRAQVFLWQGRYAEVEAYASRAAVEARRNAWPAILARATLTVGLAHMYRGELDQAGHAFERANAEFLGVADDIGGGQCLHGQGRVAHARGDFDEAEAYFAQARLQFADAGHRLGEAQTLNALGDLERDRRNWDVAMQHARDARAIFEQLANAIGIADCVNDIAELQRLRGELDDARAGCLDALRRYEALGSEHSMHVRMNLALTLAASGADPQARQLLDEVRTRFEDTRQHAQLALVDLYLVPVLARLDELDLARRRFSEACPVVIEYGVRGRDAAQAVDEAAAELERVGDVGLATQMRNFAAANLT